MHLRVTSAIYVTRLRDTVKHRLRRTRRAHRVSVNIPQNGISVARAARSRRQRRPRVREPRRGVLKHPAPTTLPSLLARARASYPRNSREKASLRISLLLSSPLLSSHSLSLSLPLFSVLVVASPRSSFSRRKRPRKRSPTLARGLVEGTRREAHTEGKAPRSTPPTIGLLSCYFLPARRTTPASSRRWSSCGTIHGPRARARPGKEKALFSPSCPRGRKSFPTRRAPVAFSFCPPSALTPLPSLAHPFHAIVVLSSGYRRVLALPSFCWPRSCFRAIANNKRRYSRNYSRHWNDRQKGCSHRVESRILLSGM